MSLLVTGSIGIDTVRTPHGARQDCLGGSSVYFAMAASFFAPVRFLGVVGDDCPFDLQEFFRGRAVDLAGLEVRSGSKTFRWAGTYHDNMNDRTTDHVELNVLDEKPPRIPEAFKDSRYVFLANTNPSLQLELLDQLAEPTLVVADTMDLWINNAAEDLDRLIRRVNGLVLNDSEVKMLTGQNNLVAAARQVVDMGPDFVVVKKGEHGTFVASKDGSSFMLGAFPTEQVVDPTGAGDTFAGGMMGYLAAVDADYTQSLRQAVAYGTVTASLVIENFSLDRWRGADRSEIDQRLELLRTMTTF